MFCLSSSFRSPQWLPKIHCSSSPNYKVASSVTTTTTTTQNNVSIPKIVKSVKSLAESPDLTSVPSSYNFTTEVSNILDKELLEEEEVEFPTIDFSLLTSGTPNQRSEVINELTKACETWGFFMVTNHGVSETLMDAVFDGSRRFFELSDEEKLEYKGNNLIDPIKCGTSVNPMLDKVFYWRDFLKTYVHPEFHFPTKPPGYRETVFEFCQRTREVFLGISEAISESLGLEANEIYKRLNLDSGLQIFTANLYPPCPQPDLALGLPPHSDHGFLTFLIQNGVDGLQIQPNGKWYNVKGVPYSFLVNSGDQLELLSNGRYKSIIHRVVVNREKARISVAMANGPSLETVVSPAPELVENNRPVYAATKYKEFIELQKSNEIFGKGVLDRIRL
ncbi:Isopenicillin N synthase [Trema orientale]|uniref:Isopenicillin N synthase n=1 Tax=Trema orientale TaxID=63057 RepID=A0A2P5EPB0_TREOI|nr:Isopenicillin N synthase [Trema orientale]